MATEEMHNFNTDDQDAKTVKACADLGSVLSSSADGSQGVRSRRRLEGQQWRNQVTRSPDVSLETKAGTTHHSSSQLLCADVRVRQ